MAAPAVLDPLRYLAGYSPQALEQVRTLLAQPEGLAGVLRRRYPAAHGIRSDKALYGYVADIKAEYLRQAPPVERVAFDSKLQLVHQALGIQRTVSRIQGGKLKAKREIRVSALFRDAPDEFLRMIVVHELAHLKETEHDKAFYRLCEYMEPRYHQFEFDVRLYLAHLDADGERLWSD
jgi:predicted metal-dependent hydrolase